MQDDRRTRSRSTRFAIAGLVLWACVALPAKAQTVLFSGGEWDFENGFYFVTHMLAGECSNPPEGGHQSCVSGDYNETIGVGWQHWASFPPPDWTGPPPGWTTPGHWGTAQFNENQFQPNVSSGVRSQEITTTCANGVGIIYRRVPVPLGHSIRFEADSKHTPSEEGWPDVEAWMGLDPTGATDPEAATVQWFPWDGSSANTWHRTREEISAASSPITLYIMMLHREPSCIGGTFMIDNVEVFDLGPTGPILERAPATLSAATATGTNAAAQRFTVRNAGSGLLSYTITDDADSLTAQPGSGDSAGETDTIDVIYDTAALPAGAYPATITILAPGAVPASRTVAVDLEIRNKRADLDGDGDVDQADFGVFQACYSGSGIAQADPSCEGSLLDADEDVDADDFSVFQACMSGAGVPSSPNCR